MELRRIREYPTTVNNCHESILRSWNIVNKVQELLEKETPHSVILEIIADLRAAPNTDTQQCTSGGY